MYTVLHTHTHTKRGSGFVIDKIASKAVILNSSLKRDYTPEFCNKQMKCFTFRNVPKKSVSAKGKEIIRWNKLQFNCVDTRNSLCLFNFILNVFHIGLTPDCRCFTKSAQNQTISVVSSAWISFYVCTPYFTTPPLSFCPYMFHIIFFQCTYRKIFVY